MTRQKYSQSLKILHHELLFLKTILANIRLNSLLKFWFYKAIIALTISIQISMHVQLVKKKKKNRTNRNYGREMKNLHQSPWIIVYFNLML